jgi:hypothetical protein
LSEDIRSLLIEQARDVAGGACGFVDGASFFAAFYSAANGAISDAHSHIIDRGILWQRENVYGFDLFFERILELLRDDDARYEPAYFGFDIGVFEWAISDNSLIGIDYLKRALSRASRSGRDKSRASRFRDSRQCDVTRKTKYCEETEEKEDSASHSTSEHEAIL